MATSTPAAASTTVTKQVRFKSPFRFSEPLPQVMPVVLGKSITIQFPPGNFRDGSPAVPSANFTGE